MGAAARGVLFASGPSPILSAHSRMGQGEQEGGRSRKDGPEPKCRGCPDRLVHETEEHASRQRSETDHSHRMIRAECAPAPRFTYEIDNKCLLGPFG